MRLELNDKRTNTKILLGLGCIVSLLTIYLGIYAGPLIIVSLLLLPSPILFIVAIVNGKYYQGWYRKYLLMSASISTGCLGLVTLLTLLKNIRG
jgi:lysylphosphatidylglycerol synthetase-like protein (DUF2156 family)